MTTVRGAQERYASDYSDLLTEVRSAGLLERRYGWYAARLVVLAALFTAALVGMFALGPSPWQLLLAVGFGMLFTQAAYLAHDAAHRQVFASGARNEWLARVVGNAVVGLSYGWWMNKHTRHHAHPNQLGRDDDISSGALVLTPDAAFERTGIAAALMRRQHLFFLPLLLLAGLGLHLNAIQALFGRETIKHPVVEGTLLMARLLGFPVLAVLAAGPGLGAALVAVELAVFGLTMGGTFAPNHKGMPIVPAGMRIDFLRRQVLMSRNISGGLPMAVAMGGLNYQIEHHLFPSMPSVNLRRARPLVRAYCSERGIRYSEMTFLGSYRIVLRYLKRVGIRHADPFECPLAAEHR